MKKILVTLAIASTLGLTDAVPIKFFSILPKEEKIEKPIVKIEEEEEEERDLTQQETLEHFLKYGDDYVLGEVILSIFQRGNNTNYSQRELHNLFREILRNLQKDGRSDVREHLLEGYNKLFPKN